MSKSDLSKHNKLILVVILEESFWEYEAMKFPTENHDKHKTNIWNMVKHN